MPGLKDKLMPPKDDSIKVEAALTNTDTPPGNVADIEKAFDTFDSGKEELKKAFIANQQSSTLKERKASYSFFADGVMHVDNVNRRVQIALMDVKGKELAVVGFTLEEVISAVAAKLGSPLMNAGKDFHFFDERRGNE